MANTINAIRTMHAKDVISAKMASAYVTVGGERYLLFQAKSLEAKLEKEKSEVAILGRMAKGHKATSINGTGNMTIYKNTPLFDKMLLRYPDYEPRPHFGCGQTGDDPQGLQHRQRRHRKL